MFRLGYTGPRFSIVPKNLKSALDNPTIVSEAIVKELERKHVAGPFEVLPIHPLHCSPLGAVPKKDKSWRLSLDLSSPKGKSVNEHISREDYSVTFTKFDDAIYLVKKAGKGALMAKLDIKHAFRIVPVHPDDWDLLGTCWQGQLYVELRLPFGCRSSVFIFNTFADALARILRVKYLIEMLVHYLDDFFTCGKANTSECARNIEIICNVFASLGVPLTPEKLIGPITCLVYLGIEIDSVAQVIQLPQEKFQDLVGILNFWHQHKKCTKRELLSLIGKLSFAAKVVRPGRIFLRRLIDLSTSVSELHHHISLNGAARADIAWWLDFLPAWNGKSIIPDCEWTSSSDLALFTDASQTLGFGAVYSSRWFCGTWPEIFEDDAYSIQWKELSPIYAACSIWGHEWSGKKILFLTDNEAITFIWKNQSSKCELIMKLIHKIFFVAANHDFTINLKHIRGYYNVLADLLSRLQVEEFLRRHPAADKQATYLPQDLWDI